MTAGRKQRIKGNGIQSSAENKKDGGMGVMYGHIYIDEEKKFMEDYVPGHSYDEIQEEFTRKFGWDIKIGQIKSYIGNHNLNTGRTGYFPKGNTPHNKGKKGVCAEGCKKTWFQKGHIPKNHRKLGDERVDRDGYIKVKVEEPNKWRLKHNMVYEKYKGKIPKGSVVIFLDGNKMNTDISNLKLVKRSELLIMNRYGLHKEEAKMTEAGVNLARLIDTTNKKKRKDKDE